MTDKMFKTEIRHLDSADPNFADRILKVLGLEGKSVVSINIELHAVGVVEVRITQLVHSGNMDIDEFQEALFELLQEDKNV